MKPHTLNPFGLENRTLTFHVITDGVETSTTTSTNRLYCWARFPYELSSQAWSTELPISQENFDSMTKYFSYGEGDNPFMVRGHQDFYRWITTT